MSDEDTTQETDEQQTSEQDATTEQSQEDGSEEESWDSEKAKRLIANLREDKKKQQERAAAAEKKAASIDDLTSEREKLAATNMQLEVGYELGLPLSLAKRLQGGTREEMLADAEALVDLVAPKKPGTRRPTETLRGGLDPDVEPEETDLRKLGSRMFQR